MTAATAVRPLHAVAPATTRVSVTAADPVSRAGVVSQLRFRPGVEIVDRSAATPPEVILVVCDGVDTRVIEAVRAARPARVVLVTTTVDGAELLAVVEAGVHGIVRRRDADAEKLAAAITAAAAGDGTLPPDLLGRLLAQVGDPASRSGRGLTYGGLSQRELDVLRLLADGSSTREIARKLAYSERTIKNTIHDLTMRLQLRNRTQAVAFAVREGLI